MKLPALSGPVIGCAHRRTHSHGELGAYRMDGCRCQACRAANTDRQSDWAARRRRGGGLGGTVLADRSRLDALRASGWTLARVSAQSGVSMTVVSAVARGSALRVSQRTADALAVVGFVGARRVWASEVGVLRRVHALQAIGFPLSVIAGAAGVPLSRLRRALTGHGVAEDCRAGVARAYAALRDQAPQDFGVASWHESQVRGHAAGLGWVGPDQWPDDGIDDDSCEPDLGWEASSTRLIDHDSLIQDLRILADAGCTFDAAAAQVGYTRPGSLERRLQRGAFEDVEVLHRLKFNDRGLHPETDESLPRGKAVR